MANIQAYVMSVETVLEPSVIHTVVVWIQNPNDISINDYLVNESFDLYKIVEITPTGGMLSLSCRPIVPSYTTAPTANAMIDVLKSTDDIGLIEVPTTDVYDNLSKIMSIVSRNTEILDDSIPPNKETLIQIGVDGLGKPTWNGSDWPSTGSVGSTTLHTLEDVSIETLVNGNILQYDETISKWINKEISIKSSLSELTDVSISNPTTNQHLVFDGTVWTNKSILTTLDALTDVSLTTPTELETLVFKNGYWKNQTLDSIYRRLDQNVNTTALHIGDLNTDAYIFPNINNTENTNPGLRYRVTEESTGDGVWEFSNDGVSWFAFGKTNAIVDVTNIDNLADGSYVDIQYPNDIDNVTFNRFVSICSKTIDGENEIYTQFPSSPNYSGIGFSVEYFSGYTRIHNTTGSTQTIKVLIQYMSAYRQLNNNAIDNINGFVTVGYDTKETSVDKYSYEECFKTNINYSFSTYESNLYVTYYESTSSVDTLGSVKLTTTDGTNTITKDLGLSNPLDWKQIQTKLDVALLNPNKPWVLKLYIRSINGEYKIKNIVVKTKPNRVSYKDLIKSIRGNITPTTTVSKSMGFPLSYDMLRLGEFSLETFTSGSDIINCNVSLTNGTHTQTLPTYNCVENPVVGFILDPEFISSVTLNIELQSDTNFIFDELKLFTHV